MLAHYLPLNLKTAGFCCLLVTVPGFRHRGSGFEARCHQIFWLAVSVEQVPLSLMRINEEQLEWKVVAPVQISELNSCGEPLHWFLCAKVGTTFIGQRCHSVSLYSSLADWNPWSFLFLLCLKTTSSRLSTTVSVIYLCIWYLSPPSTTLRMLRHGDQGLAYHGQPIKIGSMVLYILDCQYYLLVAYQPADGVNICCQIL
jgi:hypothetical protein